METSNTIQKITPATLNQWIETQRSFILIDPLTAEHFEQVHLSGAKNACVFEVTFLDQVQAITTDKQAEIVIYSASGRSMEAVVAEEKLRREGYASLNVLEGGLEAWKASGYRLEGASAQSPPAPENRLVLKEGTYQVDTKQSLLEWAGRNPYTKHDGSLRIAAGEIRVINSHPVGTFTIDMNAIENRSLAGDELQPVLIDHLKSDDFFFTRLFPTATFTIQEARTRHKAHLSAPNMDLKGELSLRGITAGLDLAATVVQEPHGTITARTQVDLDRTRWNIIYGSTHFFEHLGMHLVFDHISVDVKIVAEKVG